MKKIVLMCNGGISTGVLVNKMKEEANRIGYECEINAYAVSDAAQRGADADVILLGPQIRFNVAKVKEQVTCPVEAIDMRAYGIMDGAAILQQAKKAMGD